jgi:alpha-tubulin suppressor-like RCC1 family protein
VKFARLFAALSFLAALAMAGTRISSNCNHSLKINPDRTVSAWGYNNFGQVGDGTQTDRTLPVQVVGLTNIVGVAAGWAHSLAVRGDGTVWAWGGNVYATLGIPGPACTRPVQVPGLQNIVSVAAGNYSSIALRSDGTVWAWGTNDTGILGTAIPANAKSTTPVQVSGLSDITAISLSDHHALAVRKDGLVLTWGSTGLSQMTAFDPRLPDDSGVPTVVPLVDSVVAVAAGSSFSLALRSDGTVWHWGNLVVLPSHGAQNPPNRHSPEAIPGLSQVKSIAAGFTTAAFVRSDGSVWTLGGLFGTVEPGSGSMNVLVRSLTSDPVEEVACGFGTALALRSDGAALVWGLNLYNGAGIPAYQTTPTLASGFAGAIALAPETSQTVALLPGGTLRTVALQVPDVPDSGPGFAAYLPAPILGVSDVVGISASSQFNLALKSDGTVVSWGYSIGLGESTLTKRDTPLPVAGVSDAKAIAAGGVHGLALRSDGAVLAWGYNQHGAVDPQSPSDTVIVPPVEVPGLPNGITSLAACDTHSLALRSDGTVWSWGRFSPASPIPPPSLPTQVDGLSGVIKLGCLPTARLALKSDGTVWVWGYDYGYLGIESDNSGKPVHLTTISRVIDFAAGRQHLLLLRADGSVWSLGKNSYRQLGDGTTQPRTSPVRVARLSDVKFVAAANYRSFAVLHDGSVFAWGDKQNGALGTGEDDRLLIPTAQASAAPLDLTVTASPWANLRIGADTPNLIWVIITNKGGYPTTGTTTLTMSPGPGVTLVPEPSPWSCGANSQTITCGTDQPLPPSSFTVLTLALNLTAEAVPSTTFTYSISTPGDTNPNNDSATLTLPVAAAPTSAPPYITGFDGLAGARPRRTFTFTVLDPDGADDLQFVQFQIAKPQTEANSCLIRYDAARNLFSLRNDDATAWLDLNPGAGTRIGNSQCELHAAATRATKSGAELKVTVDVSFHTAFTGDRDVFIQAADRGGNITDWYAAGSISAIADPALFEVLSVVPVIGDAASQLFTITARDGAGAGKIRLFQLNINSTNTAAQGCYVQFDATTRAFSLLSDDGLTWSTLAAGSQEQIENSQCLLNGENSTTTAEGQDVAVNFDLQFKPSFAGSKNVYARASDLDGNLVQWKRTGTFQVR